MGDDMSQTGEDMVL